MEAALAAVIAPHSTTMLDISVKAILYPVSWLVSMLGKPVIVISSDGK